MNLQFFKLHRSYSISLNLSHVDEISEFESERNVSKVKKKDDFGVVLPYSVKWRHEISKFHVAGMQQIWLRNLQKSMMQL